MLKTSVAEEIIFQICYLGNGCPIIYIEVKETCQSKYFYLSMYSHDCTSHRALIRQAISLSYTWFE